MDFLNEFNGFNRHAGGVMPLSKKIRDLLNTEQLEAVGEIRLFLKSSEEYYSLIGKGGTGKTTIISEALKDSHGIMGVAISHKATERLSDSIEKCCTLAKALGMKKDTSSGEVKFIVDKQARVKPIKKADIIVVDECSMITDDMMIHINNMKKPHAKVIYMGDFRQLPPIEDDPEKAKNKDSKTFNFRKHQSKLTVRVRQGIGNPIIEFSDVIALEIERKTYNPYVVLNHLHDNLNKEGKGYTYLDQEYVMDFCEDFKKDNSTRFICFRNYKLKSENKKIRNLLNDNPKDEFIKGELVIAGDSFYSGDNLVMKNSEEFFIDDLEKVKHKDIDCWSIKSESLKGTIYVVSKEGRVSHKREMQRLVDQAKNNGKLWPEFFKFKESFASIDYGYAINTHKAQGSTYKTVYLDVNDILGVSKISKKEKCQSLYVGISRASDNLKLVDL